MQTADVYHSRQTYMPYSALDFPMENLESFSMWIWDTKEIKAMVTVVQAHTLYVFCTRHFV